MEKLINKNEFVNELKYLDNYNHFEVVVENKYFFNKIDEIYIFRTSGFYDVKIDVPDIEGFINVYKMFIDRLNEHINISVAFYQSPF